MYIFRYTEYFTDFSTYRTRLKRLLRMERIMERHTIMRAMLPGGKGEEEREKGG